MKYYLSLVLLVSIALTGCTSGTQVTNKQSSSGEEVGSYAALLRIKGAEYRSIGVKNKGEYTLSDEIGKVKKRVPPEVLPKDNLVSNYLDEGTLIYSVEEDSDVILVQTDVDGVYEIFKKTKI